MFMLSGSTLSLILLNEHWLKYLSPFYLQQVIFPSVGTSMLFFEYGGQRGTVYSRIGTTRALYRREKDFFVSWTDIPFTETRNLVGFIYNFFAFGYFRIG